MKHNTKTGARRWAALKQRTAQAKSAAMMGAKHNNLAPQQATALLALVSDREARQRIVSDLATLREYLEGMFAYASSPLKGQKSHPLYRMMLTANELVGVLLGDGERLSVRREEHGSVVEVIDLPEQNSRPEPLNYRLGNDSRL